MHNPSGNKKNDATCTLTNANGILKLTLNNATLLQVSAQKIAPCAAVDVGKAIYTAYVMGLEFAQNNSKHSVNKAPAPVAPVALVKVDVMELHRQFNNIGSPVAMGHFKIQYPLVGQNGKTIGYITVDMRDQTWELSIPIEQSFMKAHISLNVLDVNIFAEQLREAGFGAVTAINFGAHEAEKAPQSARKQNAPSSGAMGKGSDVPFGLGLQSIQSLMALMQDAGLEAVLASGQDVAACGCFRK
jgi:hypothetical protein